MQARDEVGCETLRCRALLDREIWRAPHVGRGIVRCSATCHASLRRRFPSFGVVHVIVLVRDLGRAPVVSGDGARDLGEALERQVREGGDVEPLERHGQRFGLDLGAVAGAAQLARQVARGALLRRGALGVGEGVEHVASRSDEGALIARLHALLLRTPRLLRRQARVHADAGALLGEQDPVAILLRQVLPGRVDVVAERDEDVALVLPRPRDGPGRDGALADRQRRIRHHALLGDLVDTADAVARRAGPLDGVRREILGVEHRLPRRIPPGARVEHAHKARQCRHRRDIGARAAPTALLLQCDGRRQAFDDVDVRHARLIDEAPRVRRDGFEVAPLRLGEQRAERQRRLARTGHTGEHDDGIARQVERHVLEVVLPRAADDDAVTPRARLRLIEC